METDATADYSVPKPSGFHFLPHPCSSWKWF